MLLFTKVNTVEKKEYAGSRHFLLFEQCFGNLSLSESVKNMGL